MSSPNDKTSPSLLDKVAKLNDRPMWSTGLVFDDFLRSISVSITKKYECYEKYYVRDELTWVGKKSELVRRKMFGKKSDVIRTSKENVNSGHMWMRSI